MSADTIVRRPRPAEPISDADDGASIMVPRERRRRPSSMSLRLRLVAALAALLTVGLAVFGVATYGVQSRAEYRRLDDGLRATVPNVGHTLTVAYGLPDADGHAGPSAATGGQGSGGQGSGGKSGGQGGAFDQGREAELGTYAELRDATGKVVKTVLLASGAAPKLGSLVPVDRPFSTESTSGSGQWRVLLAAEPRNPGYQVLVAIPSTAVTQSLRGLLLVETFAGFALLALLGAGSWLILRHGLRPLEHMAESASLISAGDLSQRVSPADGHGEVGQLGLALNSMLGEIETAFKERQATEDRLRQFLADASHELRTPLTSIQGFAELYRLGVDSDHVDRAVIMRRIEQESARMKVLVEDLLTLARLDQTHLVERVPVDLAVLAADACSDAVAADPNRPVSLDAAEPVLVSGVRDHLRQAIANLVTNALRHTADGTAIDVKASGDGNGGGIVVVRDHGHGLDDDALAHAFDRFWQADAARVGTGAGLGLSIVASIAREHGGTVRAANAPDGGAVFTITIPRGLTG